MEPTPPRQPTTHGSGVSGHLNIGNNGAVHYHAIPNQEFPSMIGMVKRIIDLSIDLGTVDSGGQDHGGGDQDPGRIERWPG
jgi:hypothetical protein